MIKSFLTRGAVVEVLANRALVSDALNRRGCTPVAGHVLVFNPRVDFVEAFTEVLHGKHLVEDILGLLFKFLLDEVLDSFARHPLILGLFASSFLFQDKFLHFVREVLGNWLLNNLSLNRLCQSGCLLRVELEAPFFLTLFECSSVGHLQIGVILNHAVFVLRIDI